MFSSFCERNNNRKTISLVNYTIGCYTVHVTACLKIVALKWWGLFIYLLLFFGNFSVNLDCRKQVVPSFERLYTGTYNFYKCFNSITTHFVIGTTHVLYSRRVDGGKLPFIGIHKNTAELCCRLLYLLSLV